MRTAAAASAALGRREAAAKWSRQWRDTAASADALQPLWRCNPGWSEEMHRLLQDT
jgi:hypothetical protein